MSKNYTVGSMEPTAFITVRKQRQKQNGKNVYLHNRTEFEIELYNPTTDIILAKISLNGSRISNSGIVLKPGQRVFLERYLDEDRKFLFETYEVSNNQTNQRVIENNGLVVVEFFNKMIISNLFNTGYTYFGTGSAPVYTYPQIYSYPNTITIDGGGISNVILNTSTSDVRIETGRVEKAGKSNQDFETNFDTFNTFASWIREWKILPYSAKDKTTKDLVKKCSNCETKLKDNFNFCPQCGNKISRTETEIHYTLGSNVTINGKVYSMSTYNGTLIEFLDRNKNKLIYIKSDSLTENSLKAIVID